jgi:plastocyanin
MEISKVWNKGFQSKIISSCQDQTVRGILYRSKGFCKYYDSITGIMHKNQPAIVLTIAAATMTLLIIAAGVFVALVQTPALAQDQAPSTTSQEDNESAATTTGNNNASEPEEEMLDGVGLSFAVGPEEPQVSDLTTMTMNVTDESGIPVSHVDWLIKIISPSGQEVFKSSTLHSHVGKMQLGYAFQEAGENTVSVQVASLGPKMMGMDVPEMAKTRIFQSGDMMRSPEVDPTFFFGTTQVNFTVNVASTTETSGNLTSSNQTGIATQGSTTTNGTTTMKLDGSEPNTKVKIEFLTDPQNVTAGEPATLVLRSTIAENGTMATHTDSLFTVSKDGVKILESGPKGDPMMPMNGSFHGHTGEIAITTVFPEPGEYNVNANINSDPPTVSNYVFGNLPPALFKVSVALPSNEIGGTNAIATSADEANHISITGQDPPFFAPSDLEVSAGTPITVRNDDFIAHTVTSTDTAADEQSPEPNGTFDTSLLSVGQEKQITIDEEGEYNYFCALHPFMRGTISATG